MKIIKILMQLPYAIIKYRYVKKTGLCWYDKTPLVDMSDNPQMKYLECRICGKAWVIR